MVKPLNFSKKLINKPQILLMLFALSVLISCAGTGAKLPAAERSSQAEMTLDEAVDRAAADISGKLPKGAKIAVVSFASESAQVSGYIMEELNFALLDRGLVVVDRANLDAARKELNFQMTGEVDDKTAQSIGKFLGVECVITGQFIFTGESYRFRAVAERTGSAERVAAANLTVRNDSRMKKLAETLNKTTIQSHSAGY